MPPISFEELELLMELSKEAGVDPPQQQAIEPRGASLDLPLSHAQERIWFIERLQPNTPTYNVRRAARFQGALNVPALESAINFIVQRHETLRTTFSVINGYPIQVIADSSDIPLIVVDLSSLSRASRESEALRLATREATQPLDLIHGPLLRTVLLRLGRTDHILLVTTHHIVSDGSSMNIFLRELALLHKALCKGDSPSLPDLPIQYADFALWQRERFIGGLLADQLDYWKKELLGLSDYRLNLPMMKPRGKVQTLSGARQSFVISPRLYQDIKILGRNQRATLFMTLLAALNVLLFRYTGQEDIVVGFPIAGRNRPELKGLFGCCVNNLALRTRFSPKARFTDIAQQVRTAALAAYAHQDIPFDSLIKEARPAQDFAQNPLLHVNLVFRPPAPSLDETGLALTYLEELDNGTAKFDLTVHVVVDERELRGYFEYNTDMFEGETIGSMIEHFHGVLEAVALDPRCRISDLPLVRPQERRKLISELNRSAPATSSRHNIARLFERQVAISPDAVAVVGNNESLTFSELDDQASRVARYLREIGVGPDSLVGLFMELSPELIVGMLGILKAGAAYLPLDPLNPRQRLESVLKDACPRLILTEKRMLIRLPDNRPDSVCLDSALEAVAKVSSQNQRVRIRPANLAYVVYTSGTTGTPNGVAVEHRQLTNYIYSVRERFGLQKAIRFATASHIATDFGNTMVLCSLCFGGTLHVIPSDAVLNTHAFFRYLNDHDIDCLKITPSHLATLLNSASSQVVLPTRWLILGGEPCPTGLVEAVVSSNGNCRVANHYGPTETTVGVTTFQFTEDSTIGATLPIGRPLANVETYILDDTLEPVPIGIMGELYIGGAQVARGYLNRPALTAQKFIPNPFGKTPGGRMFRTGDLARYRPDHNVEFLGRVDDQIKIRGFRVEPAETQHILHCHPDVQDCAVLPRREAFGDARLVAYVVAKRNRSLTLAGQLRYALPNSMAIAHVNSHETDFLYAEIFGRQAYLRHGIKIGDGDCIFDVGANIGLFTLFVNEVCRNPKVYAFEPQPQLYKILSINTGLYAPTARHFNFGLSDKAGTAQFTFFPNFSILSGFHADFERERRLVRTFMANNHDVEAHDSAEFIRESDAVLAHHFTTESSHAKLETMSHVLRSENVECVDLLKINVEKSELDVLNGLSAEDWEKIRQIVLEVDDADRMARLLRLLEKHGYDCVAEQDPSLAGTDTQYVYAIRPTRKGKLMRQAQDGTHIQSIPSKRQLPLSAQELKQYLESRLPDYAIPTKFALIESLPRLSNGKIDHHALASLEPKEFDHNRDFVAPRTSVEKQLAAIWCGLLGVERIGIHDDFFQLGGHSLTAARVMSRLPEAFQVELPLRDLFERPTLGELASAIEVASKIDPTLAAATIRPVKREPARAPKGMRPTSTN